MVQKLQARMKVNNKDIELNPFVESYVANVTLGVVRSLKGVDYLKKIEVRVDRNDVEILVNGGEVELTPFPQGVIASTLRGLVSALKGAEAAESINIHVDVTS